MFVHQADLLDQPVETEPDGRIGDPVVTSQLLERARRQQEAFEEGQILVVQVLDPQPLARLLMRESFNNVHIKFNSIENRT